MPGEEEMRADLVHEGKIRGLADWEKFDVYSQHEACNAQKQIAQTRRVLTWKLADGEKCVKARLAAESFQDPDLQGGPADTSGCVSIRPSHLEVISLSAIQK